MSPTNLHSSLTTHLRELVDHCDFLQLSDSQHSFPNSKGTGLPILCVTTPLCTAHIALQGAHLLSFCTSKGKPLLWVSPNCDFTPGIALRGGIPVCLPWFGPHPADASKPKHGFVRNHNWQLHNAILLADQSAQLTFHFSGTANELFEFDFTAQLVMTLSEKITLDITITNADKNTFDCSWVLHSYHPVSSLQNVRVRGLKGKTYLDNLEHHAAKTQQDDVSFATAVDRVYPDIENPIEIVGSPQINIAHHNCPSVVVWNPGATTAAAIADIGAGNEQHYICVERGAVLGEKWVIAAGESKTASVVIAEITA